MLAIPHLCNGFRGNLLVIIESKIFETPTFQAKKKDLDKYLKMYLLIKAIELINALCLFNDHSVIKWLTVETRGSYCCLLT